MPRQPVPGHFERFEQRVCRVNGPGREMSGVDQRDAGVLPALQALPARVDQAFEQRGRG